MKYIRIKDKLLIAPELYDNGGIVLCSDPPKYETRNAKNEWGCVDISEVIKTADTIEELCDAYIGIYKENKHIVSLSKELETLKDCEIIFGAIWCEWGLKYVAKMNSKGELELL